MNMEFVLPLELLRAASGAKWPRSTANPAGWAAWQNLASAPAVASRCCNQAAHAWSASARRLSLRGHDAMQIVVRPVAPG
jgi:hypothetical protein